MVAYGRNFLGNPETLEFPKVVEQKDVIYFPELYKLYCTYKGEGMNVSVAVTESSQGIRSFHGAGKVQASTDPADMRLQRMLGHISALAVENPKKVLVVACGAGVTAGSFIPHPEVESVTICDIEPLVPTMVTPKFSEANFGIVDKIKEENPTKVEGKEVRVVFDDGRHFIRTTKEKFDVITSDPIDPWVKGCAALNTVEYYQMCKDHLNPGGVVTLWLPLYESDEATAKSAIGTFLEVFPHGTVWSNDSTWGGYDIVMFGQVEPTVVDLDKMQKRLSRTDHDQVLKSLIYVGFGRRLSSGGDPDALDVAIDLFSTYAGHGTQLKAWAHDAQINYDRNLRLQYLAGWAFNQQIGDDILKKMLVHYKFPDDMIQGTPEQVARMKAAMESAGRKETPVKAEPASTPVEDVFSRKR
jgi:spermidine synthase